MFIYFHIVAHHLADEIFKFIFLTENVRVVIQISLKIFLRRPVVDWTFQFVVNVQVNEANRLSLWAVIVAPSCLNELI